MKSIDDLYALLAERLPRSSNGGLPVNMSTILANTLTEQTPGKALDATQGAALKGLFDQLQAALNPATSPVAFSTSISFTAMYRFSAATAQTTNLTFVPTTTGAIPGAVRVIRLVADGTHSVNFGGGIKEVVSSAGVDNRADILNVLVFFFDGVNYWVNVFQEANAEPLDIVPPSLVSAVLANANPNQIVLTYNDSLDTGSVPATSDFTVSGGKTVSGISLSGMTLTLTVNSNYANGDVVTVSYVPGTSKLRDTDSNLAAALTSQAVTNNIAAPNTTLAWTALTAATYSTPYLTNSGGTPSGGRSTTTITASQPFTLRHVVPSPASETSATVVYLDAQQADDFSWITGKVFLCGYYQYGGDLFVSPGGYAATATGVTVSAGDVLQLIKLGNDVLLQRSTNGGSSFITVYTFTGALSGQSIVYIKALFAAPSGTNRIALSLS